MKGLMILFLVPALVFQAFSQGTQQRNVPAFSGIKVAEGIDVYLIRGEKEHVRLEVAKGSPDDVVTEVSGSYLKIHMRNGFRGNIDAKVYVTYVRINKLAASSAGNIYCEEAIRAEDLEVQCSSAANIEISIDAGEVEVSASSAAQVELTGKAKSLNADASSAAQINAYDLEAEKVNAEASSAGSVKLHVVNSLEANASSGGSIRYRGNPGRSITNSSSGGFVKKSG